jgi:hypothetical protein
MVMNKTISAIAKIFVSFGLSFLTGFVLWKMWPWFMVPLGIGMISYWHVMGLYMMFRLLTLRVYRSGISQLSFSDYVLATLAHVVAIFILYGVGYLISGQM